MQNKKNTVWILIVILVIGFLVFITINNKKNISSETNVEQNNMENTQKDGVKITILQEGSGDVAKANDNVSVNYTGRLEDGTIFDSNVDPVFKHVQPFVFTLGAGQVIRGWDVGVEGMKVGEKRKLEIEPEYAYGSNGVGEVIPPNSKLIFEVELVEIVK